MEISHLKGKIIRWFCWMAIWLISDPVLISKEMVMNDPSSLISPLLQFVTLGVVLELIYRKLVWGRIVLRKGYRPVTVPECPENPWKPIVFDNPPLTGTFEVFCCDGIIRNAKTIGMSGKEFILEVDYEVAVIKKQKKNPWGFRPMQWRNYR